MPLLALNGNRLKKRNLKARPIRVIDQRYKPPVSGIDLWQALNYIRLEDVSLEFIYNRYTSATVGYEKGARPKLEKIVESCARKSPNEFELISKLAGYVTAKVQWAGYYEHEQGRELAANRGLSEEELIRSGYGWCNEQARLFCALAQVARFPARIVFASTPEGDSGHVVSEVLTSRGWMLVDQSFGHCFIHQGRPANAWEITQHPRLARHHGTVYRALCHEMTAVLGVKRLSRSFSMSQLEDPMEGFRRLGYCNYWVG
jgi:hypothetical protein